MRIGNKDASIAQTFLAVHLHEHIGLRRIRSKNRNYEQRHFEHLKHRCLTGWVEKKRQERIRRVFSDEATACYLPTGGRGSV